MNIARMDYLANLPDPTPVEKEEFITLFSALFTDLFNTVEKIAQESFEEYYHQLSQIFKL